jgi:hypothetical protein
MVISIDSRSAHAAGPSCRPAILANRRRVLERLYQRKLAVDELIRSLEGYREMERRARRERMETPARCKCS